MEVSVPLILTTVLFGFYSLSSSRRQPGVAAGGGLYTEHPELKSDPDVKQVMRDMCRDYHICDSRDLTDPDKCQEELARRLIYEMHNGYVSKTAILAGNWLNDTSRDDGHQTWMVKLAKCAKHSTSHPWLKTRDALKAYNFQLRKEAELDELGELLTRVNTPTLREALDARDVGVLGYPFYPTRFKTLTDADILDFVQMRLADIHQYDHDDGYDDGHDDEYEEHHDDDEHHDGDYQYDDDYQVNDDEHQEEDEHQEDDEYQDRRPIEPMPSSDTW
jgi:hypothetical protein